MAKLKTNFQKQEQSENFKINDEIQPYGKVRIIGSDIQSEVVTFEKAQEIASNMNLDLIEINGNLEIPIIRIDNFEKFLYERKKKAKQNKQPKNTLKEIRLTVSIAKNDLQVKANKVKEFAEDDCKIKVILTMKGREMSRREENKKSMYEFLDMVSEFAIPEAMPKDEGNKTIVILKKRK